ncbi:helix-turn-helix domain-containing protein [Magnetospirillum aberrantis]|uniref:Helix-turn-helix transcriptional regulator n=1 Tax=Magnetospirillum aberrantis SpK TaxID=908842 RepID=A0A7C9UVG9_9PROT|nr:helix-turn-helix transcriptional regulator [Magnetospirillum aberrantis SpK]
MWVPPEQHKIVGGALAGLRKRAGLKQQDVAERLGKPQSFVSAYEAGQRRIDVLELARIAQALGLEPEHVFGEIMRIVPPGA